LSGKKSAPNAIKIRVSICTEISDVSWNWGVVSNLTEAHFLPKITQTNYVSGEKYDILSNFTRIKCIFTWFINVFKKIWNLTWPQYLTFSCHLSEKFFVRSKPWFKCAFPARNLTQNDVPYWYLLLLPCILFTLDEVGPYARLLKIENPGRWRFYQKCKKQ
jgi:hypothetical protein